MARQGPGDPLELGRSIRAARRLIERAPGGDALLWERAAAEREALEPLSEHERVLTLSVVGVDMPRYGIPGPDRVDRACEEIAVAAELLDQALGGQVRDIRSLERLWHDAQQARSSLRFATALTLSLAGHMPLSLVDAAQLLELRDLEVAALVALGVGRAARAGCGAGERLLLRVLSAKDSSRLLQVALVKGAGGGLEEEGYRWIAARAREAHEHVVEWGEACGRLAALSLTAGYLEPGLELVRLVLKTPGVDATVQLDIADKAAEAGGMEDLLARLADEWTHWPPAVRAALLQRHEDRVLPLPERWREDRSAAVLLAGLSAAIEAPEGRVEVRHDDLLSAVGHAEVTVRRAAARLLKRRRGAESTLRPLPGAPEAQVVSLPAFNMARSELDRLRLALWSGDSELIGDIVGKLAEDEVPAARLALREAVRVPDMALRREIVAALGRIGRAEDAPLLIDVARRYRTLDGVVASALRALEAAPQAEALGELFERRLRWADDQAVDDFCELAGASEATPWLLRALETRFYPPARAGSARAIARYRIKEGIFALRHRSLSDPQEEARHAALNALRSLGCALPTGDDTAGYALLFRPIARLDDAVKRAREAGSAALPGLRQTLASGSWKRRRAACEVLAGLVQVPEAEDVLLDVLLDQDEDVRLSAATALHERDWTPKDAREHTLGAIATRQPLAVVDHEDRLDVATLEQALELGGHVFRNEILDALERIEGWAPKPEHMAAIRATRLDGLGALDEAEGVRAVLIALDRTWQSVPHRAVLVRALRTCSADAIVQTAEGLDLGWRAREGICLALAREGDDACVPHVADMVRDDDDDVRRAALHSLTRIGTTAAARGAATGLLSPFREDRRPAAHTLARIGQPALPVIEELADEPWWECRAAAAEALCHWQDDLQDAVDLLVVLAVDGEYRVSQRAREGLMRHGLVPSTEAVIRAIRTGQSLTLEGMEPWLRLGPARTLADPAVTEAVEALLTETPEDALPHVLGGLVLLRAAWALPWLEEAARGEATSHLGVRMAAADALRRINSLSCWQCAGRGSVVCPTCDGAGEMTCHCCDGSGVTRTRCVEPDCNAGRVTRAIDSPPCKTCRGRGWNPTPCKLCHEGHVTCDLCDGSGRLRCPLCEGSGDAWHRT